MDLPRDGTRSPLPLGYTSAVLSFPTNMLLRTYWVLPSRASHVGAARKVFPHWSQKRITHHCLLLFPTVLRLGYQTN